MAEDFVCPMCGATVSADASECPGCGEPFSPVNGDVQPAPEDLAVPEDPAIQAEEAPGEMAPEQTYCEKCDSPLDKDGGCQACAPKEQVSDAAEGCPICGSRKYTAESGDLVSCGECGNVYVRKEFEGPEQSWKWKFWVGLIFIIVGDVGVALGSYIHNVAQWSPLGAMYLGYGWIDQLVGAIGIILFILGLILFAWSFKRDREVQCPSCKVIIREDQFDIYEPEEEEEVPQELAVESALEEIGEMAECPSCGANVSMFDTSCANCGEVFEVEMEVSELPEEPAEPAAPERFLTAKEINEDEMVMESLELESPDEELNGNDLSALQELESAFELSLAESTRTTCPSCGAGVGGGLDTCPGCGKPIPTGKNMKGGA